jgi:hypothetical protein
VVRVSEQAGDFVHFSGDGKSLHWSLGPTLFTASVEASLRPKSSKDAVSKRQRHRRQKTESDKDKPVQVEIGFQHPYAKPNDKKALVGGRIVTMGEAGVIEDGVIVMDGNRIVAVGPRETTMVPEDALKIDVAGQVILPGFVDAHAHGASIRRHYASAQLDQLRSSGIRGHDDS